MFISDKPLLKARVKYDYVTCQEDELTLRVGDIVDVLEQKTSKEGWWKVRLRDKDGLAPDNFLEINDSEGLYNYVCLLHSNMHFESVGSFHLLLPA